MKYLTKEWYEQCQLAGTPPFDKSLEDYVRKVQETYRCEYEKMFPCPPDFMKTINKLHDCNIVSANMVGNDYTIITANGEQGFDGYTQIILKNAILKKKDFENQKLGWCYEELYPTERGYELHVLMFEYGSDNMYDLIVECEDIETMNSIKDISPMKTKIIQAIDENRAAIIACGEYILQNPELGYKEFKTAKRVQEEFEKLGIPFQAELAVTGVKGVLGNPDADITVCVIGEMDAVKCFDHPFADPETGAAHTCGHNVQIANMIGAAYGIAKSGMLEEVNGRVVFFAVPAEEFAELDYRQHLVDSGKITYMAGKHELVEIGAFDDVDIAMMIHAHAQTPTPKIKPPMVPSTVFLGLMVGQSLCFPKSLPEKYAMLSVIQAT